MGITAESSPTGFKDIQVGRLKGYVIVAIFNKAVNGNLREFHFAT